MSRQLTVQDIDKKLDADGGFSTVLNAMAHGGSELEVIEGMGLQFGWFQDWVRKPGFPDRLKLYNHATQLYKDWFLIRIIDELKAMGLSDTSEAFNDNGTVRAISEMPVALRRTIQSIEVEEIWEEELGAGKGRSPKVKVGEVKKIKFNDKNKALEQIIKQIAPMVQHIKVSGSVDVVHSVDQFDLDERLKQLRAPRTTPPTLEQAKMVVDVQEVIEDAIIMEKERAGADI